MPDIEMTAQVIGLNPDYDQFTGERYTQVTFAREVPLPQPTPPPTGVPGQSATAWKYLLHLFIPNDNWSDQFKMWQKYSLTIKDTGEMALKPE